MEKIYISEEADEKVVSYFKKQNYTVIKVEKTGAVYDEVSAHPDIYMCRLGASAVEPVFIGNSEKLSFRYPGNVIYNAAVIGNCLIHKTDRTSNSLIRSAEEYILRKYGGEKELKLINVPQGYTKCNMVIVDDSHFITEDRGIEKAVRRAAGSEIEILLISPGQVRLRGFPNGFIGGASGRVGNEIVFNGDITAHSDYKEIKKFIEDAGLSVRGFDYPLTDIGSIIHASYEINEEQEITR